MGRAVRLILWALAACLLPGCDRPERVDLVVRDATIVDVESGEPLVGPDSCIFLGYRHYYGGQRELAGKLYEICAEMHPQAAPLWLHIARAREVGGDGEGAIAAYRRALELNPWFGQPAAAIQRLEAPSATR